MHYIIPLILTIIVEAVVIYFIGLGTKKIIITSILANIISNPLLNLAINAYTFDFKEILLLEIIVVIFEALFFRLLIKEKLPFFTLSFIINATSFLIGLWLPWNLIWRLF